MTRRWPVAAAYGLQGLGYAAVVTALPDAKARFGLDDTALSGVLLGVCIAAAMGSALAEGTAVRRGSRTALVAGLLAQATALAVMATTGALAPYLVAVALYGLGLGTVDASANMQGVALQGRLGVPVLGRLYSVLTLGGILGALMAIWVATAGGPAALLLGAVGLAQLVLAVAGTRLLLPTDPARPATPEPDSRARPPLPRAAVWAAGSIVLVAYVLDAAVSTWSTIYLADGLAASDAVAPAGYAAYLATVLVARLATDPSVLRHGRRSVALVALGLGVTGCALVVLVPVETAAVAGLALTGAAVGALVPIAFATAGDIVPSRRDEVVARVNVFNYLGAVTGAVLPGLVGSGAALRLGFVAPAAALLLVLPVVLRLPGRLGPVLSARPTGGAA